MSLRLLVTLPLYLLATVLGLVLLPSPLPPVHAAAAGEPAWTLSPPAEPAVEQQLATITAARLFAQPAQPGGVPGGQPPPPEPPLTPPDWRISAVYTRPSEAVAVLSQPGQPDKLLHTGDTLPGGARILAIRSDGLRILLHGRRLTLSTYPE
ncbi:MAG: hypothetical protein JO006_10045 [Paucibacter sp.]|nr:hypothetical protein [Roseateles sp.]